MKVKINILYSKPIIFLIGIIILLSFCQFPYMSALGWYINCACYILCTFLNVAYILKGKCSKFAVAIFIYCISLFISTICSEYGSILFFIKLYYPIFSLILYLDYGLKRYSENIITAFFWIYFILIFINFYTIVKYPNGWYTSDLYSTNWFFGYDNVHIFMYLPGLMFMIFRNYINEKSKFYNLVNFIMFFMITYGVYYCFSANSVVAYTVLLIYLILKKYINKVGLFNSKNYLIAYFTTFFAIVVMRLQNAFRWLIVNVLGKDLTFSTRTTIWDQAFNFIKNKLLLGYGQEEVATVTEKFSSVYFTHCHNTILDVMYKGGIIGLISHIWILILSSSQLYKNRKDNIAKVASLFLLCALIMMLFESRQEKVGLYVILILCYNIEPLIHKSCKKDMLQS